MNFNPCKEKSCKHFGLFGINDRDNFFVGRYENQNTLICIDIGFAIERIGKCFSCKYFIKHDNYERT